MTKILGASYAEKLTLPPGQATPLCGTRASRPTGPVASLVVQNKTGAVLYIGGPGVDAVHGYPLADGEVFPGDFTGGLYALSAAGGEVRILEGF